MRFDDKIQEHTNGIQQHLRKGHQRILRDKNTEGPASNEIQEAYKDFSSRKLKVQHHFSTIKCPEAA